MKRGVASRETNQLTKPRRGAPLPKDTWTRCEPSACQVDEDGGGFLKVLLTVRLKEYHHLEVVIDIKSLTERCSRYDKTAVGVSTGTLKEQTQRILAFSFNFASHLNPDSQLSGLIEADKCQWATFI